MAQYIMKCMPYMNQHTDDGEEMTNTDNVFNVKETVGLARRDIFTDYLIKVEKKNIQRPNELIAREECDNCESSNVVHIRDTADLVCDGCGKIVARAMSDELTYREEQETSEKIINYSYKRENHFNEWLSQFQAQEMTNIPPEVIDQLRSELKKMKIKKLRRYYTRKDSWTSKKIKTK